MKYEIKQIREFIKHRLNNGPSNMVLGLSGGLDSAVVLYLVAPLVDEKHNLTLLSLSTKTNHNRRDETTAHALYTRTKLIDNPNATIELMEITDPLREVMHKVDMYRCREIRTGNFAARLRMMYLYDRARTNNAVVLGTENKTEMMLGYSTIGGDSISDIEPIKDFYKTEVREIAKHLGVPQEIINQAPSAGLWEGQTDEEELGFTYADADKVLMEYWKWFSSSESAHNIKVREKLGRDIGVDTNIVDAVLNRMLMSRFKQEIPYTYRRG